MRSAKKLLQNKYKKEEQDMFDSAAGFVPLQNANKLSVRDGTTDRSDQWMHRQPKVSFKKTHV